MDPNIKTNLNGLKVVSFESRRAKRWLSSSAVTAASRSLLLPMREIPDRENQRCARTPAATRSARFRSAHSPMTGRGHEDAQTRRCSRSILKRGLSPRCGKTQLAARGPKPIAALKELGLVPDVPQCPNPTTCASCSLLSMPAVDLRGKRVAVQEYAFPIRSLFLDWNNAALPSKTIPIYKWALPVDIEPLRVAIQKILKRRGGCCAVLRRPVDLPLRVEEMTTGPTEKLRNIRLAV